MSDTELRQIALEAAVKTCAESSASYVLNVAREYYKFLTNQEQHDNA